MTVAQPAASRPNEQRVLWNGRTGRAWVDTQAVLDQMFAPLEALLVDAVRVSGARRVLDVGCGTGGTTLAVARRLGDAGSCVGIDVSVPMIVAACARAKREGARASFVCADAQTHAFASARFDTIISRFGVMFFDDPAQAFANLRRAATDDAVLWFVAWRDPADNPFMTTAERAAAALLPDLPVRRPGAPGPFFFAEPGLIASTLKAGGWTSIDVRPLDAGCSFAEKDLADYLSRIGPVALALKDADELTRRRVAVAVRDAFEPFVHQAEVRFTAACWLVSARAAPTSTQAQEAADGRAG
ncbi:class I SAM-dependent methyltransferase [Burkholderia singularis]|uniref:Methyltransferase n=1 Tax=Burkholderia singularis TaxID=1503053 RepID=A0A238H5I9_9BURK|nr:class I SAM-dependent methyltransferase [Burkholderia singularis]SMG00579.1 Methyltransferase [Burkholderia singularis]